MPVMPPRFEVPHCNYLQQFCSLCNPVFTEAAFVSCKTDAFFYTVRREDEEYHYSEGLRDSKHWWHEMDLPAGSASLQRTSSQHSYASGHSSRSQTVRARPRKHASYMSSSASSITTATSDKSLTSFPSFSPESPKAERTVMPRILNDSGTESSTRTLTEYAPSIVESLTAPSTNVRTALFDDTPLSTQAVLGPIHNASNEYIEKLIARNGAVALVRQLAEDVARHDTQITALRRKAEDRERALRKIILECGISSLHLEARLRAIEVEQKAAVEANSKRNSLTSLEGMMSDAMGDTVTLPGSEIVNSDATLRAVDQLRAVREKPRVISKGWKDFFWVGSSRQSSRASSVNGDTAAVAEAGTWAGIATVRKSILQNGLFQEPETASISSRASSPQPGINAAQNHVRKGSSGLAALALKLVAGNTNVAANSDSSNRGRSISTGTGISQSDRAHSTASFKTTKSTRTVPLRSVLVKVAPKSVPISRRAVAPPTTAQNGVVRVSEERWDTMGPSRLNTASRKPGSDNYGPVEMDNILPPDDQPPTLTQIYNNPYNQEFLTDRFGFIYDQRRKKRQKDAERVRTSQPAGRVELLMSARSGAAVNVLDTETIVELEEERPSSSHSTQEAKENSQAERWQDYLHIATSPTELLSHTPSGAVPAFEVMEGGEGTRSPGYTTEERGFLPPASTTASQPIVTSDNALISRPVIVAAPPSDLAQEDTEPVKLLLKQLGEVHDSLQREKTIRWNDFLRKVRAERKRDGQAAAAALAAIAGTRAPKAVAVMPEATLTDGEMIGVAGLGNKGKVGRAKWNEFKGLVLGGIPVAYRAKIWAECSGAAALRIPGYYDSLISRPETNDDPAIVAQIQMDINRTLTDNIFFRKGPGVSKLNEVLLAYSRRNAEVGYCQGMNLITACLLLIMPTAEDAFWILTSIIENILPRGYYDHSLLASRADQQVLRQYVSEVLPKLSSHLDDLSIELEALTFQWFLSVFTDCLSAEALFRVWDVVLCTNDGSTFLFQVALALLKLNESPLLLCETPAGVYTYINHQMTNHAISIDGLIHASEGLRRVVKREDVENRRARAIEAEKDLIRQREQRNARKRAERLVAAQKFDGASETAATDLASPAVSDDNGELDAIQPRPIHSSTESSR